MDVHFTPEVPALLLEPGKGTSNFLKHRIRFEQACEVFFDPFVQMLEAGVADEAREAALGLAEDWTLLYVVHMIREENLIRIISARPATRAERRNYENQ